LDVVAQCGWFDGLVEPVQSAMQAVLAAMLVGTEIFAAAAGPAQGLSAEQAGSRIHFPLIIGIVSSI
jgi:hypothetical protein